MDKDNFQQMEKKANDDAFGATSKRWKGLFVSKNLEINEG